MVAGLCLISSILILFPDLKNDIIISQWAQVGFLCSNSSSAFPSQDIGENLGVEFSRETKQVEHDKHSSEDSITISHGDSTMIYLFFVIKNFI